MLNCILYQADWEILNTKLHGKLPTGVEGASAVDIDDALCMLKQFNTKYSVTVTLNWQGFSTRRNTPSYRGTEIGYRRVENKNDASLF